MRTNYKCYRIGSPGNKLLLLMLAVTMFAAFGCLAKTGTHQPVDLFSEMHYNQSIRSQEQPRLSPPVGAIPITYEDTHGQFVKLTLEQYAELENPLQSGSDPSIGETLFTTNCVFCHGINGMGDGPVSAKLVNYGGIPAANLTGPATVRRSDGEIFGLISQGGALRTQFGMPRYEAFLSSDDRWALVKYIRLLQAK